MKTNLTPEQSQRLIELGVDPSKASSSTKVYEQLTEKVRWESKLPIFDLTDILALLPKELEVYYDGDVIPYHLVITTNCNGWEASYYDNETLKTASELIDALYELLVWCLTNKYLNL